MPLVDESRNGGVSSLFIVDEEYQSVSSSLSEFGRLMEEKIESYLAILRRVSQEGIADGLASNNIVAFTEVVRTLVGQFSMITGDAKALCESFVSDIDAADSDFHRW